MAFFKKTIVRPGTYLARSLSGQRIAKTITADELKKIAQTGNQMLEDGHLIPAPYGHTDKEGVYPVPLDGKDSDQPRWDHAINAGFWKKFEIDEKGALAGILETDDEHAKNIGSTYRQTSALLAESWTDGKGRSYAHAPLHVCVTNKAVEPDQENFAPIPASSQKELAVAMSLSQEDLLGNSSLEEDRFVSMSEDFSNPDLPKDSAASPELVSKIKQELKAKLSVTLPDDTDATNFLDRFLTILVNLEPKEGGEDEFSEPSDSETLQSPAVMSDDLKPKSDAILQLLTDSFKSSFRTRVENLVKVGKIGRSYADEKLIPMVNSFAMSLDDLVEEEGMYKPKQNYLQMALDVLEDNESLVDSSENPVPPAGAEEATLPADMEEAAEITEEEVNSLLDSIFPQAIYPTTS